MSKKELPPQSVSRSVEKSKKKKDSVVDGEIFDKQLNSKTRKQSSDIDFVGLETRLIECIELSKKVFEQNKKIKHRITMITISSYIKLFIFLAPIILGIIFLPPLFKSLFAQYGDLLGVGTSNSGNLSEVLTNLLGGR